MQYRDNVFLVDQAVFRCKDRWGKNNVWNDCAFMSFKAVKNTAVYKNRTSLRKFNTFIPDQAKCGTRQYSNKFHLMMPVPVDAVKVKRPDIFVVIRKRKALVSMRNGFVKIFIGYNTGSGRNIYIHGITSKNSLFWDIVP